MYQKEAFCKSALWVVSTAYRPLRNPRLCAPGVTSTVFGRQHLAERIAKHRPFPQGARGRHTVASKILSPNGITRSVSSWEEVGGDGTRPQPRRGPPHSLRPPWRWGFSGGDLGYSDGGLTQTRGSLVYPGHPPHTPAQLLPS